MAQGSPWIKWLYITLHTSSKYGENLYNFFFQTPSMCGRNMVWSESTTLWPLRPDVTLTLNKGACTTSSALMEWIFELHYFRLLSAFEKIWGRHNLWQTDRQTADRYPASCGGCGHIAIWLVTYWQYKTASHGALLTMHFKSKGSNLSCTCRIMVWWHAWVHASLGLGNWGRRHCCCNTDI